ncbi:hypothetical protein LSAT2_026472 [Lamellibrachia satsuma]|nr:hypothetical protein LSAT2_026472 [Lamellibrachia satsuma]
MSLSFHYPHTASGCTDGTTEGLQDERHVHIAACGGEWAGHVENASMLCADGWHVCSSRDSRQLKTITWKVATSLPGCYAFNAAQDDGGCRPCLSLLEQDDLAGVGRGCPHQSIGQKSCISGGKIDVSCCVDTHFNRACTFRPGLASGVLCCQNPGMRPEILVHPKSFAQLTTGVMFVLSCRARGSPPPRVEWYKDDVLLPNGAARISVLDSGYLLVSETRLTDTGLYQCRATNSAGNDTANAKVIVTDYASGCADGSTEGLSHFEGVQACGGAWRGHVKRGRHLCARGWHVCSARHAGVLKLITWTDATLVDGCYAYNAANKLSSCSRCHRSDMAGVGSGCGHLRRNLKSCLTEGRIDVLKGRSKGRGCSYMKGVTSGVLCCKKPKKKAKYWDNLPWYFKSPHRCRPKCANRGRCVAFNRCQCDPGYKGAWCQNAICSGGCNSNAFCLKPEQCRCKPGYHGNKCERKSRRRKRCRRPCRHSGRCRHGRCKCPPSHYGATCQHKHSAAKMNRTEW